MQINKYIDRHAFKDERIRNLLRVPRSILTSIILSTEGFKFKKKEDTILRNGIYFLHSS